MSPPKLSIALQAAIACWVLLASANCEPNRAGEVVAESTHFRYFQHVGDDVCSAILPELERHYVAARSRLGFSERAQKIEYHKTPGPAGECPSGAGSCTIMRRSGEVLIYSANELHEHELIHGYLFPEGSPHPLYSEGVADAFYCSANTLDDPPAAAPSWQELVVLPDGSLPAENYRHARSFVRHLLDQVGIQAFMQFYRLGVARHTIETFRQEFEVNFRLDLDEVWGEAQARRFRGGAGAFCICDGPTPTYGAELEIVPLCRNDFSRRALLIPVTGRQTVLLSNRGAFSGIVGACSGDGNLPLQIESKLVGFNSDVDQDIIFVGADDTYYVDLWDPSRAQFHAPLDTSTTCPPTSPLAVSAPVVRLVSGTVDEAEFHVVTAATYSMVSGSVPQLCEVCGQCSPLYDGTASLRQVPAGDVLLRATNTGLVRSD